MTSLSESLFPGDLYKVTDSLDLQDDLVCMIKMDHILRDQIDDHVLDLIHDAIWRH